MITKTQRAPFKVGLTGGIASGKTTVANLFAGLGVPVIDTDVIAREVVEPGQPALDAIRRQFGESVFSTDGSLDRSQLRELVFAAAEKRRELEEILHPLIRKATLQAISEVTSPYCIVVVPLMFETGFDELVDHVMTVDTVREVQLARLMSRDNTDAATAEQIIASQLSREARNQRADEHILNNGHLDLLDEQVHALHKKFLGLAAAD